MDLSGKNSCIKCDKGGNLLSCSDISCPIAVHQRCLGFPAKFDDAGNFYCPYCSYRRATEESRRAWEKVLLRKRALSSFIDMEMIMGDKHMHEVGKSEPKRSRKLLNTGNGNHCLGSGNENKLDEAPIQKDPVRSEVAQEDEYSPEITTSVSLNKENDVVLQGKENNIMSIKYGENARPSECNGRLVVVGYQTPSGPIVACGNDDVSSEKEEIFQHFQMVKTGRQMLLDHLEQHNDDQPAEPVENHVEDNHFTDSSEGERQGRENSFSSAKSVDNHAEAIEEDRGKNEVEQMEEQLEESNSSFASDPATPVALEEKGGSESADSLCRELDATPASERVMKSDKRCVHPTDANCLRRSRRISSSALKANIEQIEELNDPNDLDQVTEPSPGFSRNLFPGPRRKKLPWKDEEEEMLREGVQKYSTTVNKNIPWRKILEFGRHIFHGTRTPVDLKDKWRNILAKES